MSEIQKNNSVQTCPQCDNHCPADALQCGKGRKYFGAADENREQGHDGHGEHRHAHNGHAHGQEYGKHGQEHGRGGRSKSGLAGLFHRCGHFLHHTDLEETELFCALTDEEKATLGTLLEKLSADWQTRFGGDHAGRGGHGHHGPDGEQHPHHG